jgi:hypothetical protein
MVKRKKAQEALAISKRATCAPSGYTKQRAELSCGVPGMPDEPGKARLSPYLKTATSLRPKQREASVGLLRSDTNTTPSCGQLTVPRTAVVTPPRPTNMACTFIDSAISFCKRSAASCREMSEAVPSDVMFFLPAGLCGVHEAKLWAETMGLEHARSYALLLSASALLYGQQFSDAPNMIS